VDGTELLMFRREGQQETRYIITLNKGAAIKFIEVIKCKKKTTEKLR
jgi:hypothetical protein